MALDPSSLSLAGKTVLVTGAAAGIGEAIAENAARFGAELALCDRDGPALERVSRRLEADGHDVASQTFDVRDATSVEAFVAHVTSGGRKIDVLVNNAGGTFLAPFVEVSSKGQQALVDLNFTSVSQLIRTTLPHMPAGGSIINITSVEAHRAGPGYAIYSAMKAAVENLTRSLALELGDREIRVNCIAPDAIPTPGVGPMDLETPLARKGHPDDVAGAALFLASDLARFVTGSTLHVDGGTKAAGGWRRNASGGFEL